MTAARTRRVAVVVVAAVFALMAPTARADGPVVSDVPVVDKRMWFAEKKGELALTASFTEIFDQKGYESLSKGFPVVVQVRTYVYQVGATAPVALRAMRYRLVYDLWDEIYLVERVDARGIKRLRFRLRSHALRAITQLNDYPVASLDEVAVGPRYFAGVVVELNPVSPQTQAQMRRWLTRRAGEASSVSANGSLFGSLVSVFVNPRLKNADRIIHLRSQPFFRVPPTEVSPTSAAPK